MKNVLVPKEEMVMERWERSLDEAVNYAHSLPDEFIIEK